MSAIAGAVAERPLSVEEWDDEVRDRYTLKEKAPEEFRNYEADARSSVREFYRLNHQGQTFDFVQAKKREYLTLNRKRMSVWQAMEFLNTLVDDSDPDTDLTQIQHLLQTAEAIRAEGHPDWFVLTGLIHDLGKILCLWGEPQWAVVGDTFPVGCRFSPTIVFHEYFNQNSDSTHPVYSTEQGIYSPGCGISNIHLSWGHDEYLYHVVRNYLPDSALAMIRYHSFYPWHRENAYQWVMDDHDRAMLPWVRAFNPFDLYSKADAPPDVAKLRPYYEELIAKYFPAEISW